MGWFLDPIKINPRGHGCDNTKELARILLLIPLKLVGLEWGEMLGIMGEFIVEFTTLEDFIEGLGDPMMVHVSLGQDSFT
jgi:hypothetical protein